MKDNFDQMNRLFDAYRSLLTDKQIEIFDLYYGNDLSLSEIAEELSISKAAVSDLLSRTTNILEKYENKLHAVEKYEKRLDLCQKMLASNNSELKEYANLFLQIDDTEGK